MGTKQITIIGAGLIGGTIAKSLLRNQKYKVTCVDREDGNLNLALEDGASIENFNNLENIISDSDFIFVCTPVIQVPEIVKRIMPYVKKGAVITDVGSTKSWIIENVKDYIVDGVYFIGGHPMAGSERTGYQNSSAELFKYANYILVPCENIPQDIMDKMKEIIIDIGANPILMSKEYHDYVVASASHLPYITSICLSTAVGNAKDDNIIEISAGGLRDMTRISASSAKMWKDICITNRQEIRKTISNFREEIDKFISILDKEDYTCIEEYINNAQIFRQRLAHIKKL